MSRCQIEFSEQVQQEGKHLEMDFHLCVCVSVSAGINMYERGDV